MGHVISRLGFHSMKVEGRETGEASRGHDQPVSADVANRELRITIDENEIYGTSFEEEMFKKLKEAKVKGKNRRTAKPKIQKVSLMLRDHKHFQEYREPKVLSIGPIHHDKPECLVAEEYKHELATDFIDESGKTKIELYRVIKKNIEQLRKCFDEEVICKYKDEDLSCMLFVDGCAILKFIHSFVEKNVNGQVASVQQDCFVQRDLFLLENQLPYRILDDLIQNSKESEKLRESVQIFIDMQIMTRKPKEKPPYEEPVHLLDLLRYRLLGCTPISHGNNSYQEDRHSFRKVEELKAVGIHLQSNEDGYLGNITFTQKWKFYGGILSLPPVVVNDLTGPMFFNLVAYEMCPGFVNDHGVISFIYFLDSLIDEPRDVRDLRKAGILCNRLGNDKEVARVFNEMGTNLLPNPEIYKDVRQKIQQYYEKRRMPWITEVIHDHFSNPWTVVAFIAGLFVLNLSVLQTMYTMLGFYHPK